MADNETTADIIAWLRRPREGENAYLTLWRDEIADRLEAAHKRELSKNTSKNGADFGQLGDAAKLREACANIAEYARSAMCHATDAHLLGYLNQIEGWSKAALSVPPRNCDRFKNADEAIEAVDTHCEHAANGCIGCPAAGCYSYDTDCRIAWLFAPATEKEGGAK